jgi:serine/threonine protein phosphatase PrpC
MPYEIEQGTACDCGRRESQEDMYAVIVTDEYVIAAVFDGHGGPEVAKHCCEILKNDGKLDFLDAHQGAIDKLGIDIVDVQGTTATVVTINKKEGLVYSENVGDSEAILFKPGKPYIELTKSHNTNKNVEDVTRIRNMGGCVFPFRRNGSLYVMGSLNMTRSIGDTSLAPYIIQDPHCFNAEMGHNDVLVVASDGLWDVMNPADAYDLIYNMPDCTEAAMMLVNEANARGTQDNITVVVVRLVKV